MAVLLLQIIDKSVGDGRNRPVEIVFTTDDRSRSFVTEFAPSFPAGFREDLVWYFSNYLPRAENVESDRSVVDRLISHGKYIGDRLLGDDLQLTTYREEIEDRGYGGLTVSIESDRIDFFEEPWEAMILPDSKYVLSSVVKGFTRRWKGPVEADGVLEYGLGKDAPLRIVHAVYFDECGAEKETASVAYSAANGQLRYDGAVDHELWPLGNWEILKERLSNSSGPVHVFRYDGPLDYRQGMFYLPAKTFSPAASRKYDPVSLLELVQCLKTAECGLLILNVTDWSFDSLQPLSADTGLALAAQISMGAGMLNVLGLNSTADPWTSDDCLNCVYENLFKGLSVAQAVVEARKALQAKTESDSLSFSPVPFQSWSLPVHYASRPVVFFSSAQPPADMLNTRGYADARQKMHGFFSEFLPPYSSVSGDSVLPECLSACESGSGAMLYVHGGQGLGKTQLLHMLAFCLVRRGWREAFYFDYGEHFYSVADIRQMTAPVLDAVSGNDRRDGINGRCVFMLDNVGPEHLRAEDENDSGFAGLAKYLNKLIDENHLIVVTGFDPRFRAFEEWRREIVSISLRPLNALEQRNMASRLLVNRRANVNESRDRIDTLLACCRGNPFLIRHVLPKFSGASHRELIDNVKRLFVDEAPMNCVDVFYAWQWRELSPTLQRWLILLAGLRDVILEMLAVVCDAKNRFAPVSELSGIIGEPEPAFTGGIVIMEEAGFIVRYPAGRVINPRCIKFILKQGADDEVISANRERLEELLSRIVCGALAAVIPQIIKKADPSITRNLISNRWQWAKHLENVWEIGEHEEFLAALSSLAELLKQAGLSNELAQWSLRLLSASNEIDFETAPPVLRQSWLKLLSSALASRESVENGAIGRAAESCRRWIKNLDAQEVIRDAGLFTAVIQFLQTYHRMAREWALLQEVCEIGLRVYREHEVWPLAVQTLNLLIECCTENGDVARARIFERQLLNEIPMDRFPEGFKWQLQAKTVKSRVERREFDAAQELLDQMYDASVDTGYQRRLLDMLQADIHYRQEKLEDAALIYRALLETETDGADHINEDFFRQRYAEIKAKLGV